MICRSVAYMNKTMDLSLLMTSDAVTGYLEENGGDDSLVSDIRDCYEEVLGYDPIWRYPFMGDPNGGFVVPVQEGFLWLPSLEDGWLNLQNAKLLSVEALRMLKDDLRTYVDDLQSALSSAAEIVQAVG